MIPWPRSLFLWSVGCQRFTSSGEKAIPVAPEASTGEVTPVVSLFTVVTFAGVERAQSDRYSSDYAFTNDNLLAATVLVAA